MNREKAKQYIRTHPEQYLKPDHSKKGYICPICRSGSGKNGTGITTKDGIHFTCWAGCFTNSDIIDIIGLERGITDYKNKLEEVAKEFNIIIEKSESMYPNKTKYRHTQPNQTKEYSDYTDFFLQAHKNIEKTDYWKRRGLSKEIVDRFNLGYVEQWSHPKATKTPVSPRLIIPTSKESYLARDTREQIPEKQKPYSKSKVGSIHIFNIDALQSATKPIFIVEGELDALSIIDVGGEAVALGSTAKVKNLIELLKTKKPEQPLIISLDNDTAGEKASKELENGLNELKIPFYRVNIAGGYKDPNEALMCSKVDFRRAVEEAECIQKEAEQAQREEYLKNSTESYLQSLIDGITDSVNTPCISTGFSKLDEALDGGLYEGLYIVGAISSLGKTTLLVQIADQIAQNGKDVLIFSLEMARTELMAKSISRHTLQTVLNEGGNIQNAKTSRGITTGKRYENYSQTEKELINRSIKEYKKYSQHIFISEGIGDIGVQQIRETVRKHILYTGNTPIVFIDYLQILAPYSDRATDKQNTDKAVIELKRISRDYKTAVIGVSSFNRANYKEAVAMEAFKESGAIEYSSDVLIGLQLKGAGGKDFNAIESKQKNPREIDLVILKNRSGEIGDKIPFKFYPKFNYFEEYKNLKRKGENNSWDKTKINYH